MLPAKLSVTGVSKTFREPGGQHRVLRSLNMTVAAGEFVSIIGPSGSGKSTLLHLVAGVEEPTGGVIAIDGRTSASRLGASGYVMQKPLLLPWKTVRENVMLGPVLQSKPLAEAARTADELLKKFGLSRFAGQYPRVLSGGMAGRVALLRTILFNKDFLLLDEPFGALDALTRRTMQLWLLDVWSEFRSTVLCVTHDIREAILLSDKIYVLGGQPATVIREVTVELPRPRTREHLNRPDILLLEKSLEDTLLKGRGL